MEMTAAWGLRWDEEGETAYPSAFVLDANGTVTFAKVSNSHGGRASSEEILATLKE
jgi:alkyl hydroperoxide reductase subunit AhpC